jgi:predicted O-linked N-acetylglucosamine transferase (SPINDLY family)
MNYQPRYSATEIADAHRAWGRGLAERLGPQTGAHGNDRDEGRRLKIGYVSADLRAHPVAAFVEPVLANHDPERVEVTCYSTVAREDAVTARLRGHVQRWRHVAGQGDQALADLVRADEIDVLVDLSGHTGGTRVLLFARKPAPVQFTYVGYPNTTGLEAMDWRITDAYADPPGLTEALHTEQLARLPESFLCFEPTADCPPVRPVPAHADGFFTYGCFNNLIKIGPDVVRAWARILLGAPGSRLLLKNASLSLATVRARVEGLFAAHGVPSNRLQLMARVGHDAHLRLFNQVGLHLDTFPYNGTATTFEATWMGVPTLSLAGDRHAARVGVSHAMNLGLPDLVAASVDDYVERAIGFADTGRLAAVKTDLRERMRASPLMNHSGTTRAIEAVFRGAWRAWCS